MGTPALFFYSVLCFFSDDINKLYCVEWKKARKSTKFLYFWGAKKGDVPYMYTKMGVLRKI